MRTMNKPFSILLVLFFFCTTAMAQEEKKYVYTDSSLLNPPEEIVNYDTVTDTTAALDTDAPDYSEDEVVTIDTTLYYISYTVPKDSVAGWKAGRGFEYTSYLDSLLRATQAKQKKAAEEVKDQPPAEPSWLDNLVTSNGLQYFLWFLAGAFVLFILYNLFLADGVFKKSPKTNAAAVPDAEEEHIDEESDFDKLIRTAVQSGNFRLATRYHYLQTLHLLAGKKQIQLAADKTNYQYVREVVNKNLQNDFSAITLNYEYVWYGEFAIDEIVYSKLKTAFVSFKNKI